jgi:hypothetical protein
MNACRSCGASIVWAITRKGKTQPLDSDPTPDGPVIFVNGFAVVATPMDLSLSPDAKRYTPHHMTCPQAAKWHAKVRGK